MKIELRSYYWPKTPELREIKLIVDNKEVQSNFMDSINLSKLIKELEFSVKYLKEIEIRLLKEKE